MKNETDSKLLIHSIKDKKLNREDFRARVKQMDIDLWPFQTLKPMLHMDLGVRPNSPEDEKSLILMALQGVSDPREYLKEHMQEGERYFLVNKAFWHTWVKYVNMSGRDLMHQRPQVLENKDMFEKVSVKKLRPLRYNIDYVPLPERAWLALNAWYGPTYEVMRKVIKYKKGVKGAFMNPDIEHVSRKVGDNVLELEIDEVFIFFAKISSEGKKPKLKTRELELF